MSIPKLVPIAGELKHDSNLTADLFKYSGSSLFMKIECDRDLGRISIKLLIENR